MGATTNSLQDIVTVQQNCAAKNRNPQNAEATGREDTFRRLIEKMQTGNAETNQDSTDAQTEQSGVSAETSSFDAEDINKQIAIAAMMSVMPSLNLQQAVPVEPDAVNVEAVDDVLVQNSDQNMSIMNELAQTEEKTLAAEPEPTLETVENQPTLQTEQTAAQEKPQGKNPKPETDIDFEVIHAQADPRKEKVQTEQNPNAEIPLFRKVDAMPIRVGDVPADNQKVDADVPSQLGDKIIGAIREKVSSLEVKLNPERLGEIHIELKWLQDGSLHISMKAEKLGTQAILEQSAGALQNILEHNEQNSVYIEIRQAQEENLSNHEQNGQQQDQQQNSRGEHKKEQQDEGNRFLQELRLGLTPIGV